MQNKNDFDLVIIGGGIAGLSAAYFAGAQSLVKDRRLLVLEQSSYVGGKIRTDVHDIEKDSRLLLEVGADSMLSTKPEGIDLARQIGLGEDLVETRKERQVFVFKGDRLIPMPEGLMLAVPKRLWPFMASPLFSWRGKLRMALDLLIPRKQIIEDESMGSFIRRRLGQEALDLLAEPILSGIYGADPDRQSLEATFPQMLELERKYGGLIRGSRKSSVGDSTGKRKTSLFVSFRNGMQTLVDGLERKTRENIRFNASVVDLQRVSVDSWRVVLENGEVITTNKVLITTPAKTVAHLFKTCAPRASDIFSEMRQTSTGWIYLAYRREQVSHALNGYGFLIPKTQSKFLNAATWVSSKIEGRCPDSHVLIRGFFGGERRPDSMHLEDREIAKLAGEEIGKIHGISGEPQFQKIFRSMNGNPQYDVGHLDRIKKAEALLPRGISVIGCGMRGVGIPDCIKQAKQFVG